LRLALKNFNYIERHFDQIYEDQFDFHLYTIRKFTLNSYFEMIQMEDKVYKNKFAVRAAIGMLKVAKKTEGLDRTAELAKLKPEIDQYKSSKEYQQLQEEIRKRDEDDDFKHDADPKGYDLYEKFLADPMGKALEFAMLVAKYNPDAAELHAKLIPQLLARSKPPFHSLPSIL
jgi:N-alpha-acetyltransferase 15/16, NatA auxiliary subunit